MEHAVWYNNALEYNFKVHKEHKHIPPPRPITSGSGSMTENIGTFIEYHIKNIAAKHATFLEDTPDFLRIIDKLNNGPKLPENSLIVTWDARALFTNILHTEGLASLTRTLEKRETKNVPTEYLVRLMELILKYNIFEFHDGLWKQEIGAAMGSRPVPHYADIFMSEFDDMIKVIADKYSEGESEALPLLKRFLDDYISLFVGSTKKLHQLFDEINQINPSIQLTMSHTTLENESMEDKCDCEPKVSIPFLDTQLTIKDGRFEVDLYRKDTDRNMYLLPSS